MSVEFYPPIAEGHSSDSGYGVDVALLAGDTPEARYEATLTAIRAACDSAGEHASSGTFLGGRLLGWNCFAYPEDLAANRVDVYTAFYTGDDRPANWPSVEFDKAAIDAVLAAMAPP